MRRYQILKMSDEKTFYVGINEPGHVRRELLGCSKNLIGVLKTYDDLNNIRSEKIELIIELKNTLKDIKRLNNILKEKLPAEKIRVKSEIKIKRKPSKKKVPKKLVVKEKSNPQIKKLEDELSEIESRLNGMTV